MVGRPLLLPSPPPFSPLVVAVVARCLPVDSATYPEGRSKERDGDGKGRDE